MRVFLILLLCFFSFSLFADKNSKIIDEIYKKYIPIYKKYSGVLSKRSVFIKKYDPKTGELKSTMNLLIVRKNYFYKAPDVKVLKFIKNGKVQNPNDYSTHETAPFFPIFDEKGRDRYVLKILKSVKCENSNCFKIQVRAKKKDFHILQGFVFVDKKSLEIKRVVGTPSDSHFAVKEFKVDYFFSSINGVPVLTHGRVVARIHVFIVMPDSRFFYAINSITNKPMKKE